MSTPITINISRNAQGPAAGTSPIPDQRLMGNVSGVTATPSAITPTQAKTMLGYRTESEVAAAIAAYAQPLDSDLTSIAGLETQAYGRSFLVLENAGAGRSLLELSAIATSGSASDLTAGTVPNDRLSAQVVRTDLTNTFSQSIIVNGIVTANAGVYAGSANEVGFSNSSGELHLRTNGVDARLVVGVNGEIKVASQVWHTSSETSPKQRLFFQTDSTTYLKGHGSTPIVIRNASDQDLISFSSDGTGTFINALVCRYGIQISELSTGDGKWLWYRNNGEAQPLLLRDLENNRSHVSMLGTATDADSYTQIHSRLLVDQHSVFNTTVVLGVFTVATLPSPSANAGAFAQVTDSNSTTNGSTVSGGGSNRVPVFSNGTNWIIK